MITAGPTVLEVAASALTGAVPSCTSCHSTLPQYKIDRVALAFDEWASSAHSTLGTSAGGSCESCHGPLGGHLAGATFVDGTTAVKPVAEFAAAVCAVCHDRPGERDEVRLWRQSTHSDLARAVSVGAGVSSPGSPGAPRASCNRCHSAQGFLRYLAQLTGTLTKSDGTPIAGSYPGSLVDPATSPLADAGVAYLQGLGITADGVQPQTCQTCHDPHTAALRIEGATPMLPAGFSVVGAGKGAICFVCHNSRNGARSDQLNGVYSNNSNPGTPVAVTSIGSPHDAAQGDVVAGRNAFFVGAYRPSAHLGVEDTCVGCHMRSYAAGLDGTGSNHTWRIDSTVCASCHGGAKIPVDGVALQGQFDAAVGDLAAALSSVGQATVRGTYYKGTRQTVQIPNDAVAVFVTGLSPGFALTFSSPISDPNATSGTVMTLGTPTSGAALGNFYTDAGATTKVFDVLKGTFSKASWNARLLTLDRSRGVHNPSFAFDVLSATLAAVYNPALPK